jgi:capsular polysaccharide biosynthesis protein
VIGFEGIIKDGRYFDRILKFAPARLARIAKAHGAYDNRCTDLRLIDDVAMLPRQRLDTAERIDAPVFLGTPDERDNWGMWLMFAVPSLQEFRAQNGIGAKYLSYAGAAWQRALLTTLGLDPTDLIAQDNKRVYACREVSLIRHSHRDLVVTDDDRAVFASVNQRLAPTVQVPAHEKIFVSRLSRTKQGGYRGLVNEEELIAALERLGFVAIEPDLMPFAEQVATFNNARVVVGLGGAAMFNTVFCRPGTRVVTIESTTVFADGHSTMFASSGLEWAVIFGDEDRTDPRPVQRRWHLDVAAAVQQVAQFT